MLSPQINPRASLLGQVNAILTGTSTRYWVPDFSGPLSIKTVLQGEAVWQASNRRFPVCPNSFLVLQDQQTYSIGIDSTRPVTTFCVFFRRSFVEDISRSSITAENALLENPQPSAFAPFGFPERLERAVGPVAMALAHLRYKTHPVSQIVLSDDDFLPLALAFLEEECALGARASRVPAVREATRLEVLRRVLRGRDFLLASLSEPCNLTDVAKTAALSPFHFHRAFKAIFNQTPHAYLTSERLRYARHLLLAGHHSVTEACLECGFTSLGSFSSLFRKKFGHSPSSITKSRSLI